MNKAGVIITDGKKILGCLPTGKKDEGNVWDIPKGNIGHSEHPATGALRELQEETGLEVLHEELIYVDKFPIKKGNLFIYKTTMKSLPPLWSLVCSSQCIRGVRMFPEIARFQHIWISQIPFYFSGSLVPVLLYSLKKEYFSQTLDKEG
jgi:8-oxo-dGTP pyrophosphatase MutT (NUDIX family)